MDFEKAMSRLAEISAQMNSGELSLEQSMKLYEEATELAKQCKEYLDKAKLTVETLESK